MFRPGKPQPTRMFRLLAWMNRPHGVLIRAALAAIAFGTVLMVTARRTLSNEAAGLFWQDQIKLGAHRVNWYLCHGWTSRLMGRTPLFDPTTDMNAATVNVLSGWLGEGNTPNRLAQLYVLARQINETANQEALLDRYVRIATTLVPALPAPNPKAKYSDKGEYFTLTEARAALAALTKALPARWHIISGTFLGAVREGTFLAHDYDLDIGIRVEEFDESVFENAISQASDLTLVNTSQHLHLAKKNGVWRPTSRPALYRILHSSGIGIDVFIHYLDGDIRWHGSAKHRWDNSEYDLATISIAGLTVLGPKEADRYLTENYGDWRTPVKSFHCSTGTPNIKFTRNLTAITENLHIAILCRCPAEAEASRLVLTQEGYIEGETFNLPWRYEDRGSCQSR